MVPDIMFDTIALNHPKMTLKTIRSNVPHMCCCIFQILFPLIAVRLAISKMLHVCAIFYLVIILIFIQFFFFLILKFQEVTFIVWTVAGSGYKKFGLKNYRCTRSGIVKIIFNIIFLEKMHQMTAQWLNAMRSKIPHTPESQILLRFSLRLVISTTFAINIGPMWNFNLYLIFEKFKFQNSKN